MQVHQPLKVTPAAAECEYQRHVNLSIQFNRWLLNPLGVWPDADKQSPLKKCLSRIICSIVYTLITLVFVPCGAYLILDVEDAYAKVKMVGPLSFFVMSLMKYFLLVHHENDIRECMEHIKGDWKRMNNLEDKKIMIEYAYYGRRLVAVCSFFVYSAYVLWYIVVPITVGKVPADDINVTFIPTPFPVSKFIIDTRYSPANEIYFSVQALAGAMMHAITSAACSLAAALAVHACGQMHVLMNWLGYLVDGRSDMSKTVDGRTASIVSHHVQILKFLSTTEKTLQQISFVEFLGCTMNMCLLGYYSIKEWNPNDITFFITYASLIASFTFNIFIFCYIGEIVSEQCRKVGEMTYMIEWYRLSGNKKLCCILIIAMSSSTIKFTAGNMVELSINTFSDVIKTAVAFLNMLRAVI